ncbi:MAG: hypothetical protein GY926_19745 [bacterium]|nr:hypothetical protein [bacterium]
MISLDLNDHVTLVGCEVDDAVLRSGQERLELNSLGAVVAAALSEGPMRIGDLVDQLSTCFPVIDVGTIRSDLHRFISEADNYGIVVIDRYRPPSFLGRLFLAGLNIGELEWLDRPQTRYQPTFGGVAIGVARGFKILLLLALFSTVGLLAVFATVPEQVGRLQGIGFALLPLGFAMIGLATIVAHELGHLYTARQSGAQPLAFISGPLRIHLRRRAASAGGERLIALAGPAAGATMSLTFAVLAWGMGLRQSLVIVVAVWSAGHIGCLLPWSGDGRQLLGIS